MAFDPLAFPKVETSTKLWSEEVAEVDTEPEDLKCYEFSNGKRIASQSDVE